MQIFRWLLTKIRSEPETACSLDEFEKKVVSWDASKLHDLMNQGKVYCECPHCGAHIKSWTTIMTRNSCYNCDKPHGLMERVQNATKWSGDKIIKQFSERHPEILQGFLENRHFLMMETGKKAYISFARDEGEEGLKDYLKGKGSFRTKKKSAQFAKKMS